MPRFSTLVRHLENFLFLNNDSGAHELDSLFRHDVIVAPATAMVESAIAIVRLSGAEAVQVASVVVRLADGRPLSEVGGRQLWQCRIVRGDGAVVDSGMVVVFRGPRSVTGEDVVELHLHGNPVIVEYVVDLLIGAGARLALPGEFTSRSLRNGKMDLTQVEALSMLLRTEDVESAVMLQRSLRGELRDRLMLLRAGIVGLLSRLELELDFVEEGYSFATDGVVDEELRALLAVAEGVLQSAVAVDRGIGGARVIVMGVPNAGKSSLFNAIVGYQRTLVSDVAGTTRDYVEERVRRSGRTLRLIDSAGLRSVEDGLEARGIGAALELARECDGVVFVFDPSQSMIQQEEWLSSLEEEVGAERVLVLSSKSDLVSPDVPSLSYSVNDIGSVDVVVESLFDRFALDVGSSQWVLGRFQVQALEAFVSVVSDSLGNRERGELLVASLHSALGEIERLVGVVSPDEVYEEVFGRFCVGK